jgi:hypothetical protein
LTAESKSPSIDAVVSPLSLVIVALFSSGLVLVLEAISFRFSITSRAFWGMVFGFVPALALCTFPFVVAKALQRIPRLSVPARRWTAAGVVGVFFAIPLKWVGDSLIVGGWVSQQSWAHLLPWGVVLVGAVGLTILSRIWLQEKWQKYLILPFVLVGLALITGDALVLPSLYQVPRYAARLMGQEFLVLALWRLRFTPASKPWMHRASVGVGLLMILATSVVWIKLPQKTNMEMSFRGGVATNLSSISAVGSEPSTPVGEILKADVPWTAAVKVLPKRRAKHVVLLLVDTLRADALSPAREEPGARKLIKTADTPFLNKFLAEECSVFRRAYAQAPATHRSIPSTFRSIESWEDSLHTGSALGTYLTQNDVSTFAVVNDYFVLPYYRESTALLEGFGDLGVYFPLSQDRVLTLAKEGFARHLKEEPSFGWIHFLGPHFPGWAGKSLKEMKPRPRYREAVRWMDSAIKDLVEDLRARGALEDTAIIIASDHGEGLGDNGTWNHGPNVWDEELRVPMAVCLPGQKGQVIERSVGNIDLQPTIVDLLGLPQIESSRGRSLMPLLDDPALTWQNPYYLENVDHRVVAMVYGGQKLIYRPNSGAYSRYDLANDPDEESNIFDGESQVDKDLQMLMTHWNPSLAEKTLNIGDSPAVAAALRSWRGDGWDPKLNLYLEFAARLDSPLIRAAVTSLWHDADDDVIRFWIMRSMRGKKWIVELAQARIESAKPSELARFVQFVAAAHLSTLAPQWVSKQIESVGVDDTDLWLAWMGLIASWRVSPNQWSRVVIAIIQKGQKLSSPLANAAAFWPVGSMNVTKPSSELVGEMSKYQNSSSKVARSAAFRVLAYSQDAQYVASARAALESPATPFIVRKQAVVVLARLEGKSAVPLLMKAIKDDELLTVDGLKAIGFTGDLAALKELKKSLHYGYNRFIDPEIKRLESQKK